MEGRRVGIVGNDGDVGARLASSKPKASA